ncbi:hypothetical protein [Prosthecochloris sp. CIB 2401]|uniref:hypothetical protein n=1 Tax=Prosthecochloris sp. CIB 2401 TaxID=1868325 RepID=UPI0012E9B74D|nr:hypothetical protein [Prosthecochloris sp. CIB 2401]
MSAASMYEAARLFEGALEDLERFAVDVKKRVGSAASACDLVSGESEMNEIRDEIDERSRDLAEATAILNGLAERCSNLQAVYADVSVLLSESIGGLDEFDEYDDDFDPSSISPLA